MEEVEQLALEAKTYAKELMLVLEEIKPKIIDAFVSIYHEKYREQITRTIQSIRFVTFLSEDFLELAYQTKTSISSTAKKYLDYLDALDRLAEPIYSEEEFISFLLKYYIFSSQLSKSELEEVNFIDILEMDCPAFSGFIKNKKEEKILAPVKYSLNKNIN